MAKKRSAPRIIVLPTGERYRMLVGRIESRREDLSPLDDGKRPPDMIQVMYDDDVAELSRDDPSKNEFVIFYASEKCFGEAPDAG